MKRLGQHCDQLVLNGAPLHFFACLGEALDGADDIVHQIINLVVVVNLLLVHGFSSELEDYVCVLAIALKDDLSKLGNQILLDEHFIKVAFLGKYEQSSHGLEQITKDVDKAHFVPNRHELLFILLGRQILFDDLIKDLKENLNVAGAYLKRALWSLHTQ